MNSPHLSAAMSPGSRLEKRALLLSTKSMRGELQKELAQRSQQRDPMFWWKVALVAQTLVNVVLFSGVIYGFSQVELILKDQGVYQNKDGSFEIVRYNTIMTIASAITAGSGLFIGIALDAVGPRWMMLLATVVSAAGCFLFGYLRSYLPGYCLFAFAGMTTLISSFRVGFVFPDRLPLLMGLVSCLFDTSAVVFAVFYQLYAAGLSIEVLFLGYGVLGVLCGASTFVLWTVNGSEHGKEDPEPNGERSGLLAGDESSHRGGAQGGGDNSKGYGGTAAAEHVGVGREQEGVEEGNVVSVTSEDDLGLAPDRDTKLDTIGGKGAVGGGDTVGGEGEGEDSRPMSVRQRAIRSMVLWDQLQTREFLFIYGFCVVLMLRTNLYLGMVQDFLASLGDEDHGDVISVATGWIVPAGVIFVPLIDMALARGGYAFSAYATVLVGVAYGALSCVHSLYLQAATAVLFTLYRASLFSVVAAFNADVFGPMTVGRISGILYTTTALFILLQRPLTQLAQGPLGDNYVPINAGFTALAGCLLPLVWWIQWTSPDIMQQHTETGNETKDKEKDKEGRGGLGGSAGLLEEVQDQGEGLGRDISMALEHRFRDSDGAGGGAGGKEQEMASPASSYASGGRPSVLSD